MHEENRGTLRNFKINYERINNLKTPNKEREKKEVKCNYCKSKQKIDFDDFSCNNCYRKIPNKHRSEQNGQVCSRRNQIGK